MDCSNETPKPSESCNSLFNVPHSFSYEVATGNILDELGNVIGKASFERVASKINEPVMKWISISEKLPVSPQWVLLFSEYDHLPKVAYFGGKYPYSGNESENVNSFWKSDYTKFSTKNHKYWMPIPNKPDEYIK